MCRKNGGSGICQDPTRKKIFVCKLSFFSTFNDTTRTSNQCILYAVCMDMSMVAICAIKSKQCHIWVSEMSGKLMLWKRSFNCFLWSSFLCYCLPCPRVVNELFGFMEHLECSSFVRPLLTNIVAECRFYGFREFVCLQLMDNFLFFVDSFVRGAPFLHTGDWGLLESLM